MNEAVDLQSMDEGTRQLVLGLMGQLQQQSTELRHKQALLDKLTFENEPPRGGSACLSAGPAGQNQSVLPI